MIVGITGGIATGKSRVTQLLHDRGFLTFSADEAGRAVIFPGSPIFQQITHTFGKLALTASGELNRQWLGALIFADSSARQALEQITHPAILRLLRAQLTAVETDFSRGQLVAVEVPLLYESHLETWFELIVVVTASLETQVERLRLRNGIDRYQAMLRISSQLPIAVKQDLADFVISNDGTEEELEISVEILKSKIFEKESRDFSRICMRQAY